MRITPVALVLAAAALGGCKAREFVDPRGDADSLGVVTPRVSRLIVAPDTARVVSGATVTYRASAVYENGDSGAVTGIEWRADGGTIVASGAFVAGTRSGTFEVRANGPDGSADTAVVTVASPSVTAVVVTPDTAIVRSGQSRQFTAVGILGDGSQTTVPVQWSATRGTIDATGRYTAGNTAGTGRVIARLSGGTVADTARITVPVETIGCSVSPGSVTLIPGGEQQFTVSEVRNNGTTAPATASWSTDGGQVTSAGLYTAGQTVGTFRVIAVLAAGAISCSADVAVQTGGGGTPQPGNWDLQTNRPSGSWTTVTDNPWTSLNAEGWGVATNRPGPAPSIVQDNSAPDGDASVLRQPYGGTGDGDEPQFPFVYWPNSSETFGAMIVKFAPTWQQPTSSGVKWLILEGSPNGLPGWLGLGRASNGNPLTGWTFNYGAATGVPSNNDLTRLAQWPFVPGQWAKLQWYIRRSPARIMVWVNDNLMVDSDQTGGFAWASSSQTMSGLQMGGTWGGGIGFPAPAGNVIFYARTAIYRR